VSRLAELNTPVFWAEGHPGALTAQGWEVEISGLVDNPATITYEEVAAMPATVADARMTSVSGWSVRGKWKGVQLSYLMDLVKPKPKAAHLQFISYRSIYTTCIPLEVALRERTLLAHTFDGEPIEVEYGGPLRIFCPYLWGYKSAKCLVAIRLVDRSIPGFWEVRGYPDDAHIKARRLLDVNTSRQRRIPGGEVIEFLD
jgi:DMSO/TMAO reductase YedYZ molybdopterin-dependent catalytic subunit